MTNDHPTLFGRVSLAQLFTDISLTAPEQIGPYRRYPEWVGRYLVTGLPGFVNIEAGSALCAKLNPHWAPDIQAKLVNGVIGHIEIMRSSRAQPPDTMLVVARDPHWIAHADVALIPYMTDEEVAAWLKSL